MPAITNNPFLSFSVPVPVAQGGTGATTAAGARTNLGLGTFAVENIAAVPALTLAGTISGAGQQLNNIIIGTTTPLAGTFTTLVANTSLNLLSSTALGGAGYSTAPTLRDVTTTTTSRWALINTNDANVNGLLDFLKSRGASIGTPTAIVTGDAMGQVRMWGYDGTTWIQSADIFANATGTIAATRVPSFMSFRTSTNAAPSILTEVLRLSAGNAIGFFGVAAATRATAYTQTYATADKTHATPTVGADIGAFTDPPTAAEMATLRTFVNALKADHADLAQLANAVIDDLQTYGLLA